MANTSALISRRETWNNMVRPGVALYGYYLPFQRAGREVSGGTLRLPVKPVLTWKTRILCCPWDTPTDTTGSSPIAGA
jgi:alanine racemase